VGLFIAYGLYHGATTGAANALIADLVPAERRGTAFGLYNTMVGAALFPASVIAGVLWDRVGPAAPFLFGAALALAAVIGLGVVFRETVAA